MALRCAIPTRCSGSKAPPPRHPPRDPRPPPTIIAFPAASQIWIAAGVTGRRRRLNGLGALVQSTLEARPFNGHILVFRGRRGDLTKGLWFDGDGLCLLTKRLERGRFVWPQQCHLEPLVSRNFGAAIPEV